MNNTHSKKKLHAWNKTRCIIYLHNNNSYRGSCSNIRNKIVKGEIACFLSYLLVVSRAGVHVFFFIDCSFLFVCSFFAIVVCSSNLLLANPFEWIYEIKVIQSINHKLNEQCIVFFHQCSTLHSSSTAAKPEISKLKRCHVKKGRHLRSWHRRRALHLTTWAGFSKRVLRVYRSYFIV